MISPVSGGPVVFGVSVWLSSAVTSAIAGGGFVDDGLVGGEGGDEGLQGEVADCAG